MIFSECPRHGQAFVPIAATFNECHLRTSADVKRRPSGPKKISITFLAPKILDFRTVTSINVLFTQGFKQYAGFTEAEGQIQADFTVIFTYWPVTPDLTCPSPKNAERRPTSTGASSAEVQTGAWQPVDRGAAPPHPGLHLHTPRRMWPFRNQKRASIL